MIDIFPSSKNIIKLPFLLCGHMYISDSSVGKESACDAGDPGLIPGLGRSSVEGTGSPLQYS